MEANYPDFGTKGEIPKYARNHAAQILNFISAVNGDEKLLIDGAEALKSLKITLGIYKAAEKGKRLFRF